MSDGKYFGSFNGLENMLKSFEVEPEDIVPTEEELLFASYGSDGGYGGDATVIFEKNDKLYEVSGSHCSCYGLEDQWSPNIVTWEALALRIPEMKAGDRWCFLSRHDREAREAFIKLVESRISK